MSPAYRRNRHEASVAGAQGAKEEGVGVVARKGTGVEGPDLQRPARGSVTHSADPLTD